MKNLYSQGTKIAYKIDEQFYGGKHFVWCSDKPAYGVEQPGNSDPIERCSRLMTAIMSKDSHETLIEENKRGIERGATFKYKEGKISKKQRDQIIAKISTASLEDFVPVIYVIPYDGVKDILVTVPEEERGSKVSKEFTIDGLEKDKFDLIDVGDASNIRRFFR